MKYNQVRLHYKKQKQKYVQFALQKMTRTVHVTTLSGSVAASAVCGYIQYALISRVTVTHKNIFALIVLKYSCHKTSILLLLHISIYLTVF